MPEWCTGIPVLVHWVAIAVLRMAAVGFASFCHALLFHLRLSAAAEG